MKEKKLNIGYTEKDGILYPNLQISNEQTADQPLGRYGRMAMEYLKENYPDRYTALKMDGSLMEIMHRVQDEATEKIEALTQQMLQQAQAQMPPGQGGTPQPAGPQTPPPVQLMNGAPGAQPAANMGAAA